MCDMHCFEKAGLGKAPFRYVGLECQDLLYGQRILNRGEYQQTGIALTTKPGGTCAYCGTYIVDMYNVESADGKRFHVGCECIRKVNDKGLVKQIDSDRKRLARDKRHSRESSKITEGLAFISANRDRLAAAPHPNQYFAQQGKTLADYVDFMLKNAGTSGKLRLIAEVRKTLS